MRLFRVFIWLAVIFVIVAIADISHGLDCNGMVNDGAGIIRNQQVLTDGSRALIDQGADVKIVTIASLSSYGSLNAVENSYEAACPSWLGPTGKRKANLFVLMVAPNDRKKNVFFGSAYSPVLPNEDTVNVIYSKAANPYFASKQWEQGFVAAMKDFSGRITAYHDQQQHPAVSTTTTTVQATDYSGLWSFLFWALMAGLGCVGIALVVKIIYKRRDSEEGKQTAQAEALDEWRRANAAFRAMPDTHPWKFSISQQFTDMSNSLKYNPNEDMNVAGYKAAGNAWRDLRGQILSQPRGGVTKPRVDQSSGKPNPPTPNPKSKGYGTTAEGRQPIQRVGQSPPVAISQPDGFVEGMVAEEILHSARDRDEVRERVRESEPEPEHRREPESYSSSGSDSSWSSSDSGSSGSDSGFGGGGDSGGGGSDSGF